MMRSTFRCLEPFIGVIHECDGPTDRQTDGVTDRLADSIMPRFMTLRGQKRVGGQWRLWKFSNERGPKRGLVKSAYTRANKAGRRYSPFKILDTLDNDNLNV